MTRTPEAPALAARAAVTAARAAVTAATHTTGPVWSPLLIADHATAIATTVTALIAQLLRLPHVDAAALITAHDAARLTRTIAADLADDLAALRAGTAPAHRVGQRMLLSLGLSVAAARLALRVARRAIPVPATPPWTTVACPARRGAWRAAPGPPPPHRRPRRQWGGAHLPLPPGRG